jgi:hypothetical protein
MIGALACQEAPKYDERSFDEMKRPNKVIEPYGKYKAEQNWNIFKNARITIDTNDQVFFTFKDSLDSLVTYEGAWLEKSLDTQKFTLPEPLNIAMFTDNGVFILDSSKMIFFKKQR